MNKLYNSASANKIYTITIITNFLSILLYYCLPFFTGYLIDHIILQQKLDDLLLWTIIVILFSVILHSCLFYFCKYIWDKYALKISNWIRDNLLQKIFRLPSYRFENYNHSKIYNLIMNDSTKIGSISLNYVASSIISIMRVVTCLIILLFIDIKLTLVTLLFIPLYTGAVFLNRKKLQNATQKERQFLDSLIFVTNKIISGKTQINLFNQEKYFEDKFNSHLTHWTQSKLKYSFWFNLTKEIPAFLTTIAPFITLSFGAILVNGGTLSLGQLVMFSQYVSMIFEPLNILSYIIVEKRSTDPIRQRLEEFSDTDENQKQWNTNSLDPHLLAISNVNILSKDNSLLFTINKMAINKNGIYLIKGDNGVGKSTLLNLFAMINSPDQLRLKDSSAYIHFDQYFIQQLSYLYQPGFIFEGTIQENITFGEDKRILLDDIASVLGIKDLDKQIEFNPINLSLGEQQKLHLARVFYHNSNIIFLDEPFSNLDLESRNRLQHYISQNKDSKVFLIISHNEELEKIADNIITIYNQNLDQFVVDTYSA